MIMDFYTLSSCKSVMQWKQTDKSIVEVISSKMNGESLAFSGIMCCRIINNVSQPKLNSTNCNNKDIVFCGAESFGGVTTVWYTVVNIDCFVCFVGLDICWQIQHTHDLKDKLCVIYLEIGRWWWWAHHKQLYTEKYGFVGK